LKSLLFLWHFGKYKLQSLISGLSGHLFAFLTVWGRKQGPVLAVVWIKITTLQSNLNGKATQARR